MRRIHPRHTATVLQLRRYHEEGWAGTFDPDPVPFRAQVEHTRHVVVGVEGVKSETVLTIRVPPSTDGTGPDPADFPTGSEVTLDGEASWVLSVRPIRWHGAVAYLELTTTGSRKPPFGGWFVTDAVLERSGGRDPKGAPLPATDVPIPQAVFLPVSTRDLDRNQDPETTAEMILPTDAPAVTSTDRVRVPTGPMAGRYQVVGDPAPHPTRTVVELRRL